MSTEPESTADITLTPVSHGERRLRAFTDEQLREHDAEVIEKAVVAVVETTIYSAAQYAPILNIAARIRRGEA